MGKTRKLLKKITNALRTRSGENFVQRLNPFLSFDCGLIRFVFTLFTHT